MLCLRSLRRRLAGLPIIMWLRPEEARRTRLVPVRRNRFFAPLLVFIHGGYWRASSAREHAYAALGPLAHGITVVVTNYALCPEVDIGEIARQSRAALAWVWHHARELEVDRERIFVAGHSAGAQQAALLLDADLTLGPGVSPGIDAQDLA